jgi:hypothetical protein
MNPFNVIKTQWSPGDEREIEDLRIDQQEGIAYDSYRRVYELDGKEWKITAQVAKPDGRKYYVLVCLG